MKSKIIAIFLTSLFTQSVFAIDVYCPSITVLKAVGIEKAEYDGRWNGKTNIFIYKQLEWQFYLSSHFKAKNQTEALEKLNHQIPDLVMTSGPNHDDSEPKTDSWWCQYEHKNDNSVNAIAISVPGAF